MRSFHLILGFSLFFAGLVVHCAEDVGPDEALQRIVTGRAVEGDQGRVVDNWEKFTNEDRRSVAAKLDWGAIVDSEKRLTMVAEMAEDVSADGKKTLVSVSDRLPWESMEKEQVRKTLEAIPVDLRGQAKVRTKIPWNKFVPDSDNVRDSGDELVKVLKLLPPETRTGPMLLATTFPWQRLSAEGMVKVLNELPATAHVRPARGYVTGGTGAEEQSIPWERLAMEDPDGFVRVYEAIAIKPNVARIPWGNMSDPAAEKVWAALPDEAKLAVADRAPLRLVLDMEQDEQKRLALIEFEAEKVLKAKTVDDANVAIKRLGGIAGNDDVINKLQTATTRKINETEASGIWTGWKAMFSQKAYDKIKKRVKAEKEQSEALNAVLKSVSASQSDRLPSKAAAKKGASSRQKMKATLRKQNKR